MSTETPQNSRTYQVDPEAARRLEICQACKYFQAETTKCVVCGCSLKGRLNEERSKCPIGKW